MEREEKPSQLPLPGLEPKRANLYKAHDIHHAQLNPKIDEPKADEEDTEPINPISREVLEFYGLKEKPTEPAPHWSDRD